MEMKNFTGGENPQTVAGRYCSVEFTGEVHGELVFLSVIDIFLSITAFLGNTLILFAFRKDTSIHPSSKLLYRNLAITDLCVGIIAEPLRVAYMISVVNRRRVICYYAYLTAYFAGVTLCSVSLITLTAISVDRLLALLLGLRYRQVVTLKRTRFIAIGGWIVSVVGASASFLNRLKVSLFVYIVTAFCLVTTICTNTKIFMSLRHNQIHVQNHVDQGQSSQVNTLNIARYRKAVYSALWVQVTLVICYLPYVIAKALTPQRGMPLSTYPLARGFTLTLVYLNSSLNPFLYCWKITEVRQAVKETLQQLHFFMEMKNFTGGENPQTVAGRYCSVEFTGEVHGELVFLSVIDIFLSITAFLGNTLILFAFRKDTSIHPSSKLLYRNLAITDLCVGIIAEPLRVAYMISVVNRRRVICYYAYLTAYFAGVTLCSVSLITLTAISVDRLLALLLGLRYRQVVTLKRTRFIAIGGWIVSVVGASASFLNRLKVSLFVYIVTAFCLVTTICTNTKIFMSLRHNQIHVQNHVDQGQSSQVNTLNIARYRKAVYSALWVQVTLVICYLPYVIAKALTPQRGMPLSTYPLARGFTLTLVYLNSSLNPFLYCWKITEVRQAVKETLQQLHFCT
ncbi:unnamed protein product [Porites evermanni]|uniref:G-protein coupled receptors family 1 profile domain-containing protein n=1 Tax=Porites evermanni TaxID=104178 RepID=A0ABN8PW27_9CNID|nr:unnamed protein product [Porites evermanni]